MFFVPTWVTNVVFLAVCWLSTYQLWQLARLNPVRTIQLWMILFCLAMVVAVTMKNRTNPWLSVGFLLVGVVCLVVMIRRHRMLPPMKTFQ